MTTYSMEHVDSHKQARQTHSIPAKSIDLRKRFHASESIIQGLLFICGAFSILTTLGIVYELGKEALLFFNSEHVYPRFAVLDPTTTFSLPPRQVANGVVDAFVHVMEQYATHDVSTPLQDRQAEAILKTLIEVGPRAIAEPEDYDARADLMWAANQATSSECLRAF